MVDMSYQAELLFSIICRPIASDIMIDRVSQTVIFSITTMLSFLSGQIHANSAPTLEVQDHVVSIGKQFSFLVAPTDIDGATPNVFVRSGPDGAVLSDNGDGTRTFSWLPDKTGDYTVNFIVQDGRNANMADNYAYNIKVVGAGAASVAVQTIGTRINPTGDNTIETNITNPSEPDAVTTENAPRVIAAAPTATADAESANVTVVESADNNTAETVETTEVESVASPSDQSIYLNGDVGSVTKILTDLPVSTSQTNVLQSSVDSNGRYLYTANIEPGPNGDSTGVSLRTVLRQGYQRSDNSWEWKSVIVDDRTMHNRWHTAPSVAVDKTGAIHVAYNMHNFPWQYKKSDRAHDITSMEFKGQQISDAELIMADKHNRTRFPTLGSAAIPGNQITYPAFYKDKNDELYISYRFAAAPKRKFSERVMSTGIAVYDTNSRAWTSIGAKHNHSEGDFKQDTASPDAAISFAGKRGWTSYLPRVVFNKQNDMFVSMFWRDGVAGRQVSMPCVVRSISRNDVVDMKGGSISLPIQPEQCGNIGVSNSKEFYSIGSFAIDNEDNPYLLLSPTQGSRFISRYSSVQHRWITEEAPHGATEIFFDNDNNMYAIASGITIFKRSSIDADWQKIYSENAAKNCYPKVKTDASGKNAFVHTQSCDEKHVTIYGLRLR